MRRFWILLWVQIKVWRHDPISIAGGFIAPLALLLAFGLLFGGRTSLVIAILNEDAGAWGEALRETAVSVQSPFNEPYYQVVDWPPDAVWAAYDSFQLDAVWVIPADFSERLAAGERPSFTMHFNNYNDDRAKNHRLYAAEILWRFYEQAGLPAPPVALAETYPRPQMIGWFSLIGVGVALFGVMLGSMFNIFMLTYQENVTQITLEYGLSPRSLLWALLPKALLALAMGLATGTVLLGVLYAWTGAWPGRYLLLVLLMAGLVALSWIGIALLMGLRARHYVAGALTAVLSGLIIFFIGGGLAPVRYATSRITWLARLFPNYYAIDPMRDLTLFQARPDNLRMVLVILAGFSLASLTLGFGGAARILRRPQP